MSGGEGEEDAAAEAVEGDGVERFPRDLAALVGELLDGEAQMPRQPERALEVLVRGVPLADRARHLAEVARVLRPGAALLGSDSIEAPGVRAGHDGDIFVPVDPDQLAVRLIAAGFEQPEVESKATRVRFAARKP